MQKKNILTTNMACVFLSTFIFALQISFYYTEATYDVSNVTMPPECIGLTYCTKNISYPQKLVNDLLNENNSYYFRNGEDPYDLIPPEIENRQGVFKEAFNPCETVEDPGFIRYIVDPQKNVRVVVQYPALSLDAYGDNVDRFTQYIPITRCKSSNVYKGIFEGTTDNTTIPELKCTETIFHFNFTVLSKDWKSFEMVSIKDGLPVGCNCTYVE